MKRKEKRKLQVRRKVANQTERAREIRAMINTLDQFEKNIDPETGNLPPKEES